MKIKFKTGSITFQLHDLLCQVAPECKRELVESLSCDDEIIRFVTQQILDKWTEGGYSGGAYVSAVANPGCNGLDWAWREVAKRSGEVAQREIDRLEKTVRRQDEELRELRQENADLRDPGRRMFA